ncbi:HigA family addiction module antidote protein [Hydrogenophaga sp. D2P1]|uniref:HigA family addiction module antidote protein n=1 Tax=Hydrogenophaga aromaticivorans TaxID=2610898 RepID=A0A7Y8GYQ3_9BURK|nr:HigA family addiction module antitoxin [Hydrogenophaga aromaticivorans]NWF46793.1 HigA family addiction module antidote protein [Hydrogenophaga aromaticivorans]
MSNYYMPTEQARTPAAVCPPGDILKEELAAHKWSQQELADILGRPPRLISELIGGKRAITPETAIGLSAALGSSPEYWMALETSYQLSKIRSSPESIKRKASLYERFPVREMVRKGWVDWSDDYSELEQQVFRFFGIRSLSEEPVLPHAAKKTHSTRAPTIEQTAWLFRVLSLAKTKTVTTFSPKKLQAALDSMKPLRMEPEDASKVAPLLESCGVVLVFVEPISSSKIDGACMWIEDTPVVGMTLRYDRIDNFWFVLRHELEHVLNGDGKKEYILDLSVGEDNGTLPGIEIVANAAAADFCTPQDELSHFIAKFSPYFSEERVLAFSRSVRVHPGLVVGQLQRKLNRHDFLRKHQVKIRQCVLSTGVTDGWGIQAVAHSDT